MSLCKLWERGHMSKSVYVRVFHIFYEFMQIVRKGAYV